MIVAAILIAATSGEALAKSVKRHWHVRHFVTKCVPQQPIRLGPMRYYGGPKSLMWRAPVEN
jgi:hypothetical protein